MNSSHKAKNADIIVIKANPNKKCALPVKTDTKKLQKTK